MLKIIFPRSTVNKLIRILSGLTLLFLIFSATPGWAHRVIIFAWAEGDTIHTESKFVPGRAVHDGQVQVLDNKTDRVLLTGKTDDQGKFSFQIPPEAKAQKMDLKVVLQAAMGHQADWLLKAENYLPKASDSSAIPAKSAASGEKKAPDLQCESLGPVTLDRQVLEQIVDQALDRKLAPIMEMLAESQVHKPSLPDVIGGIGYIVGILGIVAYFKSKRDRTS
jgi:nickel transport protein